MGRCTPAVFENSQSPRDDKALTQERTLGPFDKDTVTRAQAAGWPALGESPRDSKSRKARLGIQT